MELEILLVFPIYAKTANVLCGEVKPFS